jgi:hypothetical protein
VEKLSRLLGYSVVAGLAILGIVSLFGGQKVISQAIDTVTLHSNANAPAYVKDVVGYKEGDSFQIYFTLADANGNLTSAAGTVIVTLRTDRQIIWTTIKDVTTAAFQATKVGTGAFEHITLLCNMGMVHAAQFNSQPPSGPVTLEITFITETREFLKGTREVWL